MTTKITFILTISFLTSIGQVIYPFHKNDKWFFTDSTFKRIDKKTYEEIKPCEMGYFYVLKKTKLALADNNGNRLTDFLFDRILFDNVFFGYIGKTTYKIDKNGTVSKNSMGGHCGDGNIIMSFFETYKKNNKIGILKRTQPKNINYPDTFPAIFDKLLENFNGIAMVKFEKLWGAVNENSEYVLKPQFDSIIPIEDRNIGISGIIVIKNNLYGWLDNNAKIIIEPKYKSLSAFRHGYALVTTTKNKTGYILTKGTELFE
jgi:hypothetical protein